ncbi:diguanylate cyclase domain-containing protein [Paractinoplanes hotanensis]|uniref:Sensor-like histidine kinase SenX3 n=1 Tax=Paractinoplanes hotanensis TaxID=2906497 RepID=A0ABT0XX05_9ACTN|nr:diguanylate cyclase [Actinoplanes hotanensis]MCM4078252.1 diguanylate cyclase [Actinoplanes hotanensis]
MGLRSAVIRTLCFALVYLAATYAGRLTVMDATNLSLVWPAAGVSAAWFLAQYRSRWRVLDVLALSVVTVVVNTATGASLTLAVWFVLANVLQAGLFAYLVQRWLPHLWAAGGEAPLTRTHELWRLIAAAVLGTGAGALLGPTGVWVVNGTYSWPATAVWMTRNTVSILLIGVVFLTWGYLWRTRPATGYVAQIRARWSHVSTGRRLEYVAVVGVSAAAYSAVFGIKHGLPLAFALLVMTVWAGSRLSTAFVVLHDLLFGSIAVLFTLHGTGAFANIASHPARALVAQAFVGVIAVVGLALALGRDERAALVNQLRTEQEAAAGQAKLMTAIVDSMTEGLTVVDDQGRLLLRNPAVRRLLGGVVSSSGQIAKPDYYGLFHPNGKPIAPEEMPNRRALAGTDVHGMDILVRNPGVPEGRLLSVSSAALPGDLDGRRCAVTIFHDVTAERRHRDELATFAGVVAHDLLNPLTTVKGWTEALTDILENNSTPIDPAKARDGLNRIARAARRMRSMIDDLLDYTTARDAALAPTLVPLGDVVNDIAIARIDQAQSNGTPVPSFDISDLNTVYADPVLVHQLLENLISNAIKYTAPDVTPAIRIHSDIADHHVRVTIDDNGIGIPDGQHDSIFETFHRAHRTAGYSGTGLGLGIGKRIVERHGGTITATPNPTGRGSRFTFTLPADATTAPTPDNTAPTASPSHLPTPDPQPTAEPPASELPDRRTLPPAAGFEHAAQLVLDYLHEQIPLAFWSVTRVENGRQMYLYLDADNGYGLRQGDSHPWQDSYCIHMAAGEAPTVARDAQTVPAYANAAVNQAVDIGTYAGAPITEPDGSLFGAICGIDPNTHTNDPRMASAEPLLAMLGQLLTAALAADRIQDHSLNALLREQLSADTDALTGLPNRRAWQRIIEQTSARFQRLADPTVVAMLDLDRLKTINDTLGHAAGDAYIQAAATAARRAIRDTDFIARLGGDEFGIILTQCTEADAEIAVARLNQELEAAGVAASIGWVAVTTEDGFPAALDQADAAMYATKQQRRKQPNADLSPSLPQTS